jgi:hypothetical protein
MAGHESARTHHKKGRNPKMTNANGGHGLSPCPYIVVSKYPMRPAGPISLKNQNLSAQARTSQVLPFLEQPERVSNT